MMTPKLTANVIASKQVITGLSAYLVFIFGALLFSTVSYAQSPAAFNSGGTYSWECPLGVTSITVECWGAGGGGGIRTSNGAASGGGGGAYARSTIPVVPNTTYTIVVGAGGSGATGANSGGHSSFDGNTVKAAGGDGATDNASTPTPGGSEYAPYSYGDVTYSGGNGGANNGNNSGGGGGAAGKNGAGGNGGNGSNSGGTGNGLYSGDGGSGISGSGAPGNPGLAFGGGGGGARRTGANGGNGGNGADGLVMITFPNTLWANAILGSNPNLEAPAYTTGDMVETNISVSGISRGSGLNSQNANDRYNAGGWSSPSLDNIDYFEFTLSPRSGYKINLSGFSFIGQRSSQGPQNLSLRSSADNFYHRYLDYQWIYLYLSNRVEY